MRPCADATHSSFGYTMIAGHHPLHDGQHVIAAGFNRAMPSPANPNEVTAVAANLTNNLNMSVCQVHSSQISHVAVDCPWKQALKPGAGRGSGFVLQRDVDGQQLHFIVTNHHVIADAKIVEVTFPKMGTGTKYAATVVVDCPAKDIALLRLDDAAKVSLTPLEMANCDEMQQSSEVFAVGFPLGQQHMKITKGVFAGAEQMTGGKNFLQVTAPICPGNSGGPLLHRGKVVGINSAIIPGQNCVGYSIPGHVLDCVFEDYKHAKDARAALPKGATYYMKRPLLGVVWQSSDARQTAYLHNEDGGGLYVAYVMPGSLLANAGLKRGMLVTHVTKGEEKDLRVSTAGELTAAFCPDTPVHLTTYLSRLREGENVSFKAWVKKDNAYTTINVKYAKGTDPRKVKNVFTPHEKYDYDMIGGMVCANLTTNHVQAFMQQNPTLARYLDPDKLYEPSVIVSHINPYSEIAKSHHVAPGMQLVKMNDEPVTSVADMRKIAQRVGQQNIKQIQFTVKGFCTSDIVLNTAEMVKEHQTANTTYNYPMTDCMKALGGASAGAAAPMEQERLRSDPSPLDSLLDAAADAAETFAEKLCDADYEGGEEVLCLTCGECNGGKSRHKKGKRRNVCECDTEDRDAVPADMGDMSLEQLQEVMGWGHMTGEEVQEALAKM